MDNNNNNNNNTSPLSTVDKLDENLTSDKNFYKSWSVPTDSSTDNNSDINVVNNLSFVISTQFKNLISNLTKKSYRSTTSEITQILNQYGNQAEIYLFRTLIDNIDFRDQKNKDPKDQLKIQLFKEEISRLGKQPNFISVLCKSLEGAESLTSLEFLLSFSTMLKLNPSQEILLGLSLSESLERSVSIVSDKYLLNTLYQLSQPSTTTPTTKSLPENTLHQLLFKFKHPDYILQLNNNNNNSNNSPTSPNISQQQKYDDVIKFLQSIIPPNSLALSPFLEDSAPKSNQSHTYQIISKVNQMNTPQSLIASLGCSSCSTNTSLKEILNQFKGVQEVDIAQILGMMAEYKGSETNTVQLPFLTMSNASTPVLLSGGNNNNNNNTTDDPTTVTPSTTGWNYNVFVDVVKELYPTFDWINIIKELDYPGFQLTSTSGLSLILSVFKKAVGNTDKQFPVHVILERKWINTSGQLSFIKVALASMDFPFNLSSKKLMDPSQFNKASPLIAHWNSVSMIETLLQLSTLDQDHYQKAKSLFEYPKKNCPDLLILSLSSVSTLKPTTSNQLQNELIVEVIPILLLHHNYQSNISQLWKDYPTIVISGMIEIYQKDQSTLSRILDIAQELKILKQILGYKNYPFVIDLAVLAFQREYLFLEKWIVERMKDEDGQAFIKACISFLNDRINQKSKNQPGGGNVGTSIDQQAQIPINNTILLSFFKTLSSLSESLSVEAQNQLKQINPAVLSEDQTERRFPPDIEEETNAYFIKLYSEQISIDQIVEILREHKNSKNQRDQDIWRCLLFNLFDEYKFLSEYPEKELRITGFLFGALIKNQLISSQPLRIALKYVLEALKYQPQSKMFIFGLNALISFANRLYEWPQFWAQVCSIDHIRQYHSDLVTKINQIIESTDPSRLQMADQQQGQNQVVQGGGQLPHQNKTSPSMTPQQIQYLDNENLEHQQIDPKLKLAQQQQQQKKPSTSPQLMDPNEEILGNSVPIGALVAPKDVVEPDETTRDKVHFIVNNLSTHNIDQKVKDLKDILKPEFYEYFAHYLVMKRVIFEPNFQSLYSNYLDKLVLPELYNRSLTFTLAGINNLLRSERIREQYERGLLKNLGMWLGLNTLGKNKPLLQKLISPKDLLLYATENNLLISIVPFVAKIIDSSAQSKVFKPPNPWVMAIVKLLVEIYNLPESRNNIKFEIELVCNNLQLDITKIKPSTLINDRRIAAQQHDQDSISIVSVASGSGIIDKQGGVTSTSSHMNQTSMELITNLPLYLQYNPSLGNLIPLFKQAVPIAFDKAIREIIAPVVERSVTIAVITSKELVSKDFATEVDEKKMKKASHLMVQNLAGSLALVTCKDPLRVSLVSHLRTILQHLSNMISGGDQLPLEHAIPIVCNDNLDLACSIVERAATEKAILAIDEVLASSYSDRLKHKERTGGNQPFFDMGYLTTAVYNSLPEPLRPKPGGIQSDQFRVYEDFLNLSHITNIPVSNELDQSAVTSPQSSSTSSAGSFQQQQQAIKLLQQQQVQQQAQVQQQHVLQQQAQVQQQHALQQQQQQAQQQQIALQQQQQQQQQAQAQRPNNGDIMEKFNQLLNDVDKAIIRALSQSSQIELEILYSIAQQMSRLLSLSSNQSELIIGFTQKLYSRLCDNEKKPIYEIYFELLEILRDGDQKVVPTLTQLLLFSPPEKKINNVLIVGLIIHQLINVNEYDINLTKMMVDPAKSELAIDFAIKLIRFCIVENPSYANLSEFQSTFDIITKLAQRQPNEYLNKFIEDIKNAPSEEKKRRISRIRQEELIMDPPGLKEAVIDLLQDWLMFSSTNTDQKLLIQYLSQVLQISFMKNELYFLKFFRIGLEYSLERYTANLELLSPQYLEIDSYCKFVVLMVKHGDPTKLNILTKVLSVLIKVLTKDYETKSAFNQRPYMRIFENLLVDLVAPDPILDHVCSHILFCFVNAFSTLQPLKYPGFCFAWLDLISHKSFMPKLFSRGQKSWFHTLLIQHFRFMDPFLRTTDLNEPIRLLYKGTLKVLLVLLHDFPEFLCEFHFSFCDVIPTTCIQLRNIILSAYPRNMRLPDPFTPNLKVDLLPDINQPPKISSDFTRNLKNLKIEIDNHLKNPHAPFNFLMELKTKYLLYTDSEEIAAAGSRYNAPLINALVLYVGTQAIQRKAAASQPGGSNPSAQPQQSTFMDIFYRLAIDLDTDGRYLFFNAIANQLRYPNNHTHYFSCVLLYLFSECAQDIIKEQITRVLLERLISNKPHPWGLLITFIELIKNPRYNFWNHRFTKIAPEIEQIFDTLYKSCINRETIPTMN